MLCLDQEGPQNTTHAKIGKQSDPSKNPLIATTTTCGSNGGPLPAGGGRTRFWVPAVPAGAQGHDPAADGAGSPCGRSRAGHDENAFVVQGIFHLIPLPRHKRGKPKAPPPASVGTPPARCPVVAGGTLRDCAPAKDRVIEQRAGLEATLAAVAPGAARGGSTRHVAAHGPGRLAQAISTSLISNRTSLL